MASISEQSRYLVSTNDSIPKETLLALARGLPSYTEARYEKYYLSNPGGEPLLAVVRERAGEEPVGMAAFFPVELCLAGERLKGAIAGDLVMEPAHRTLGPALGLQRHLLAALAENGLDFVLAAPNAAAEPVFTRVGYEVVGGQARFARILRSQRLLARRLPQRVARPVSWLADPLLHASSRLFSRVRTGRHSIERLDRFDERFAEIWRGAASRNVAQAARGAAQLNWKYELDSPSDSDRRYEIFTLSQEDSVLSYLVYERKDGVLHVYEALWSEAPEALFSELAEAEPDASVIVLSCFAPGEDLIRALRRCGFVQRRSDARLYLYLPPEATRARRLLEGAGGWYFLQGDLDL